VRAGNFSEGVLRFGSRAGGALFLLFLGASFVVVAIQMGMKIGTTDLTLYTLIYATFALAVCGAVLLARAKTVEPTTVGFFVAVVVWCFLMLCKEIFFFDKTDEAQATVAGHFNSAAYGQVGLWMCATLVLFLVTVPHSRQVLRTACAGPYKWMVMFAVLCVISASYSPSVTYSLAWAIMLSLVVWVMVLLAAFMRNGKDLVALLRVALGAFGFVVVGMCLFGLFDPSDAWQATRTGAVLQNERLGGVIMHPTHVSEIGGIVLLLCLILYTLERGKKKWLLVLAILAACVMFLGAGKTAIVACVIAAVLFLMYQKGVRGGYMAALFGGLCPLFLIVFFASPVGDYFMRYAQEGQYESLSGRIQLWEAATPTIEQNFLLGHGYLASRFFALLLPLSEQWQAHMHNAFVEVLYNNGIVGFVMIVALLYITLKSIRGLMRRKSSREVFVLAAGLLALEAYFILTGMMEPTFAGHPDDFFVFFLMLAVLAERLQAFEFSSPPTAFNK
jgi:O-antigen ligase